MLATEVSSTISGSLRGSTTRLPAFAKARPPEAAAHWRESIKMRKQIANQPLLLQYVVVHARKHIEVMQNTHDHPDDKNMLDTCRDVIDAKYVKELSKLQPSIKALPEYTSLDGNAQGTGSSDHSSHGKRKYWCRRD